MAGYKSSLMLSLDRQNQLRQRYRELNPHWRPATEIFADLVRQQLESGDLILDLGCGRGGLLEQLGHPLECCIGLDPDFKSLREHRLAMEDPPLARVTAHSQAMPFVNQKFRLIFAAWVLEHLADPFVDWKEVGRVLQPGGLFVFITPNRRHPVSRLNLFLGRMKRVQGWLVNRLYGRREVDTFPTYYRSNSTDELYNLAGVSGMKITRLDTIPDPTYLAFSNPLFKLSGWLESRLSADRHIHLVGVAEKMK